MKELNKISNSFLPILISFPLTFLACHTGSFSNCLIPFALILIELFVYKLSKTYEKFLQFWFINLKNITNIDINFLIPEIPKNTFRSSKKIQNSSLYDIGCYPISLLVDLGFQIKNRVQYSPIQTETVC